MQCEIVLSKELRIEHFLTQLTPRAVSFLVAEDSHPVVSALLAQLPYPPVWGSVKFSSLSYFHSFF